MLTRRSIKKWKRLFIENLKKQIGSRYTLGGGQMDKFKGYDNLDDEGTPIGFDCVGGIIYAIEEATGIELKGRVVHALLKTEWLNEIKEKELKAGDLILVDIPGMKGKELLRDENGEIVYGVFNHVMTYCPIFGKGDIITTEGVGGDHRINPKSKSNTRVWKLSSFKRASGYFFHDATRYKYMRIDWEWLYNWKKKHQA